MLNSFTETRHIIDSPYLRPWRLMIKSRKFAEKRKRQHIVECYEKACGSGDLLECSCKHKHTKLTKWIRAAVNLYHRFHDASKCFDGYQELDTSEHGMCCAGECDRLKQRRTIVRTMNFKANPATSAWL